MKKYYFCVATIFKNESWGMKEWVEHYKAHGVDHIYMVDDGSTDDFLPILQPYIDEGYVTLYHNEITQRYKGRQDDINNHYFKNNMHETQWLTVLDMDEYLYSPIEMNLKEVLQKYQEANITYIQVNWAYFTSNGYINQPKNIVESFTKRVPYKAVVHARLPHMDAPGPIESHSTKVLFNTDSDVTLIGVHDVLNTGIRVNGSFVANEENPHFIINHYQLQSREYWEKIKMHRGDVNFWLSGRPRDFEIFDAFDQIGNVEDTKLRDMNRGIKL